MTNGKVIILIEAKIQPQRRAELVEAALHQIRGTLQVSMDLVVGELI